jgi:patatin-like phospholipase/acyl hydrolase
MSDDTGGGVAAKVEFQALALTGGGFRGLYTAKCLEVIEADFGRPIGNFFDLTCGTSIGGIVALAVAFEIPMSRVVTVFREYGPLIFPASHRMGPIDYFRYALRPRYKTGPLREAIESLIPKDAILGDALHPLAIPAVNLTQGRQQVFKTRHEKALVRDWRYKAVDIALATSAAPTFFELAEIAGNSYADGGLFANAPDLIAIHEAEHFLGKDVRSMSLLSIGTTTQAYSVPASAGRGFGIGNWMKGQRLFSVIISSQQQFAGQIVAHRLGSRYMRIDHAAEGAQANDLGLDVATSAAESTLIALAEKSVTDVLGRGLRDFKAHTPTLTILED